FADASLADDGDGGRMWRDGRGLREHVGDGAADADEYLVARQMETRGALMEDEQRAPDPDEITGAELGAINGAPIDEGAVATAEIGDDEATIARRDPSVGAGDELVVVEKSRQGRAWMASELDRGVGSEHAAHADARGVDVMYDGQGRVKRLLQGSGNALARGRAGRLQLALRWGP